MTAPEATRRAPREVFPARVSGTDLMHLSRQLAAFLRAGIPVLDALDLLAREAANATLRRALADVAEGLRSGEPMAEAFDRHPEVFPPAYRSMVRSAELTGRLDSVLDRLTVHLEREVAARAQVRAAMTYPLVIVVLSVAVSTLLVTFVLPKFRVFFASFGRQLPLPTRLLLGFSDLVHHYWWAGLAGAALLVTAAVLVLRTEGGKTRRDGLLLRVPLIGTALHHSVVERFSRVLATMLQAGVPLADAMTVAAEAAGNRPCTVRLLGAREAVLSGEGIAGPLAATGLFPAAARQMIRVGEDTGSLDEQLEAVASFYEKELDLTLQRITTLMEPAVLLVMGGIVGFVALALVSAMYGIYGHPA